MTVWWTTLAIVFFLCCLSVILVVKPAGGREIAPKPNKLFAFLACAVLVAVAGLRAGIGDTGAYRASFRLLPSSLSDYLSAMNVKGDWGYDLLAAFFKQFVSKDAQHWIFFCSLVTIALIFYVFYSRSVSLELSAFFFVTTGCYLVTMNGIRQYLASAILFAAFPWIEKRKWYLYLPLVLLVSPIHKSALLFLPLYFVVNRPAWGKTTWCILGGGAFLYLTYPVTGPLIAKLLGETQYGHYGDALLSTGAGANVIRVLVMAVPVVLSYFGKEKMKQEKHFDLIVNMSVLNLIFILLATRYWIYARFNMYFTLYMILLLSLSIRHFFREKERPLAYVGCLILYSVFYWYEMCVSLGFNEAYQHFIH